MKHIILAGGGNAEQSKKLDDFFSSKLSNKKMLFLPQAVSPELWEYEKSYEWIQKPKAFQNITIDMWKSLKDKSLVDLLEYDAIYIMGGNTFALLKKFREAGMLDLLREYIKCGKMVYGISAGAILMGESVQVAEIGPGGEGDPNDVGVENMTGMRQLEGYTVYTHYDVNEDDLLREYVKRYNAKLICIPEESGVYVQEDSYTVIGEAPIVIMTESAKNEFNEGKYQSLES